MKVRFHLLPTLLLGAFVLALTTVMIVFSMSKLRKLSEDSASTVFSLIAQRNADQLQAVLTNAASVVDAQSVLLPRQVLSEGRINETTLVPALMASLRAHPRIYSLYYGFGDGAFLQVIGVRGDIRIADRIHAPAGTFYAIRLIDPAARTETYRFLASNEKELGAQVNAATYVPSSRPWYDSALAAPGVHITDPYVYDSLQGLGLTLSRALREGNGVFGADVSLGDLESFAADSLEGRDGGILITDDRGRVLAAHASPNFNVPQVDATQLASRSTNPLFMQAAQLLRQTGTQIINVDGADLAYASRSVAITPSTAIHVVAFAPMGLYTGAVDTARNGLLLYGLVILGVCLPLTYLVARRISVALERLAAEAERIQRLDFGGERTVHSVFHEIDLLGQAQHTMKTAIRQRTEALDAARVNLQGLLDSGMQLSSRRSRDKVLRQILESACQLAHAHAGQFWLRTGPDTLQLAAHAFEDNHDWPTPALHVSSEDTPLDPCVWALAHKRPLRLDSSVHEFDLGVQRLLPGGAPSALLAVPVLARGDKPLGVLVLSDHGERRGTGFNADTVRYAQTLAAQAGIALENLNLIASQRELMDSILQLIAGAIDAKSAYTGAHCARVPELARMLAEEACEVKSGPLADFRFETDDEWREFRIGTWLHDCGKVTTPEHVVDKATKLETIYNRIHEIRTRFEVLLRDAEIQRLQSLLSGADAAGAQRDYEHLCAQLHEDYAFIAQCNIGGEASAPGTVERLREIGERTWLRYFDDRIGLSHAERERMANLPVPELPVREHLLADRPEHVVPRTDRNRYDERYGFRMEVPKDLYNFGELHNLAIERGTLTPEERFKINEHIIQTIVMLDQLPLPPNLRRVPEYAGTHHETLMGTGYPRRLRGDQLSIPARIMAIADIFEALTSSDRPYKKAKPLSEAVHILAGFRDRGHIDSELFKLFLTSGVFQRYAETYLAPEQIDPVDVASYLVEPQSAG
ncbi:metal-dependent phosphohydrolase [Bordetella ansorpii]|uniref:Metal-dependent phosphohydrolase n=1 Tax=Bordetella ansorpii TaxID=288768 RepID=A0A157SCT4_9BORD|nr:HD domain-containing phosphohydrolase [Bordetella ansorpii]SAI68179.1 metal-dependent phosphohydrolase [Bordetella ansorpii]